LSHTICPMGYERSNTSHCVEVLPRAAPRSGDQVQAHCFRVGGFGGLGILDPALVRPNRLSVCVRGLVRNKTDFRLADDDMGRVCGTYGAHVCPQAALHILQGFVHGLLRGWVNVAPIPSLCGANRQLLPSQRLPKSSWMHPDAQTALAPAARVRPGGFGCNTAGTGFQIKFARR